MNAIIRSSIDKGSGKPLTAVPTLGDIKPLDDSIKELFKMVTTISDYVDAVVVCLGWGGGAIASSGIDHFRIGFHF